MSKNTKIMLAVLAGLLLVCLCGLAVGVFALRQMGQMVGERVIMDDPEKASTAAREMLDYDLPPGYQEQGVVDMFVTKMLIISVDPSDSGACVRPVIMFAQMPQGMGMDDQQTIDQIQQSMENSTQRQNLDMRIVDEQVVTLRGQETTLTVYEGVDGQGNGMRQVISSLFPGKNGSLMMMIMGPIQCWDQAEVEAFIDSIR